MMPQAAQPETLPEQVLPSGKAYTVEALNRTHSEIKFEGSLAQVLFQAYWEDALATHEGEVPMPLIEKGIIRCFVIADKFRKVLHQLEFEKREEYDKSIRARYQKDGKTILHLPDAGLVAPHVAPGSIAGLE